MTTLKKKPDGTFLKSECVDALINRAEIWHQIDSLRSFGSKCKLAYFFAELLRDAGSAITRN